jgi:hypothetical protein
MLLVGVGGDDNRKGVSALTDKRYWWTTDVTKVERVDKVYESYVDLKDMKMEAGPAKGKSCKCVTTQDILSCIGAFKYPYYGKGSCHASIVNATHACCLTNYFGLGMLNPQNPIVSENLRIVIKIAM